MSLAWVGPPFLEAFRVPGSLAVPEIIIYSVNIEEVLDLAAKGEILLIKKSRDTGWEWELRLL